MPYLVEFLLFLAPFGAYLLWRRLNPQVEPAPRLVLLAVIGLGLGLAGAVWFGLSVSMDRDAVYVPAEMGPDGQIRPGRGAPASASPPPR